MHNLNLFKMPVGFRGRPAWFVQLWWFVQASFFKHSPQFAYKFRALLLRSFGAKVGSNVVIRPSASFTYPWKVTIGDGAWIGDDVVVYSLGEITIGDNSVVSQRSYLCAGDHDYNRIDFPIRARSITIGRSAWIATDVFVGPGVTIGDNSIVGARSSVFKDIPSGVVGFGSPFKVVKTRPSI